MQPVIEQISLLRTRRKSDLVNAHHYELLTLLWFCCAPTTLVIPFIIYKLRPEQVTSQTKFRPGRMGGVSSQSFGFTLR